MSTRDKSHDGLIHPSAFEIVELYIYGYAVYSLLSSIWNHYNVNVYDPGSSTTYVVISIMFLFVILQNYIMMRIADDKFIGDKRGFKFLDRNRGHYRFFERILRLLIIIFVILAPKYPIENGGRSIIALAIENFAIAIIYIIAKFSSIIENANMYFGGTKFVDGQQGVSRESDLIIVYYSSAILIIVILNYLWDMVNIVAVQYRKINTGSEYFNYKNKSPYGSDLFSLLSYLYIVRPAFKKGRYTIQFTDYITKENRDSGEYIEELVLNGTLWKLYIKNSPVFRCRILGFIFSILMISGILYNINPIIFTFLIGFCTAFYGFYLTKVDRVFSQIISPFEIIYNYIFSREG